VAYEIDFLKSLIITVLIETTVLLLFTKFVFKKPQIKLWIVLIAGVTASCATLPYLWFIFPLFIKAKLFYTIFSELFAVFIESFILLGFLKSGFKVAVSLSFLCNIISYAIGLFFQFF